MFVAFCIYWNKVPIFKGLRTELYLDESKMASSKRDPYRKGVAAFYIQIANYVFYAKKHNKHIKRALDFIIVSGL